MGIGTQSECTTPSVCELWMRKRERGTEWKMYKKMCPQILFLIYVIVFWVDGELLLLLLFECSVKKKEKKITLLHKIRCVFGVVHRARVSSLDKLLRLHIQSARNTLDTYKRAHTQKHWIHLKIMIVSVIWICLFSLCYYYNWKRWDCSAIGFGRRSTHIYAACAFADAQLNHF